MYKKLKKYDKFLEYKKQIDGKIIINRKSPFSTSVKYEVKVIENQFIGSANWVISEITLMDTQKYDIIGRTLDNNRKIKRSRTDINLTRDIVSSMIIDNIII